MAIEIESFNEDMSVVIFSKNFRPIGTRFLTQKDLDQFLPTVAIVSSGESEIELNIYWQTVVSMPPHYNVVSGLRLFFLLNSMTQVYDVLREVRLIGVFLRAPKSIWPRRHFFCHFTTISRYAYKRLIVFIKVIKIYNRLFV